MSQDINALQDLVAALGALGKLAVEIKDKGGFALSEIPSLIKAVNAVGLVLGELGELPVEVASLDKDKLKVIVAQLIDTLSDVIKHLVAEG